MDVSREHGSVDHALTRIGEIINDAIDACDPVIVLTPGEIVQLNHPDDINIVINMLEQALAEMRAHPNIAPSETEEALIATHH